MRDLMDKTVTTTRAAEIIGLSYEGLRSLLKKGLLLETGLMAKFSGRHQESELSTPKRAGWNRFSFADVCGFRLCKVMMDAGLSFEDANAIASRQELWQRFWFPGESPAYLMLSSSNATYALVEEQEITPTLKASWSGDDAALIIVSLAAVRSRVATAFVN